MGYLRCLGLEVLIDGVVENVSPFLELLVNRFYPVENASHQGVFKLYELVE